MYPARSKPALGRKEMAILRRVVGHDEDAAELLEIARTVARRHVVVKRMHHAPLLAPQPTRVYTGKTTRYDVYARRM
jgi:16S rRNA (guanine1516-N2)-methyltransferase